MAKSNIVDNTERMQNDLHRAEMKLKLVNRLRQDAKLLYAERNNILKKMNTLQQITTEVSNLKSKINVCDEIINNLENSSSEMQKTSYHMQNLSQANENLEKATVLMNRIKSLERMYMRPMSE
ncbi:hypothetical protein RUM44_008104 [Polyplax serrata]|uniref:Uncharacterized protein n=1 Tax=Polyplax serrata TaxID=468196 RepID=A0ABR1BBH3_POLSC